LVDYGKLQYQQEKLAQKSKKSKHGLKEIRLSLKISDHDLEIKTRKAKQFLQEGHKVKINLKLMGRERQFKDKAYSLLEEVVKNLEEKGTVEIPPHQENNQFICQLTARK